MLVVIKHILMYALQKLWLTLLRNRVIGNYYNFLPIFMKINGKRRKAGRIMTILHFAEDYNFVGKRVDVSGAAGWQLLRQQEQEEEYKLQEWGGRWRYEDISHSRLSQAKLNYWNVMYKSNMTEWLLCSESAFDHGERKISVNCDICSTTFLATPIMWYMPPSTYLGSWMLELRGDNNSEFW